MPARPSSKNTPQRTPGRPKITDVAVIEKTLLSIALAEFLEYGYGGASLSRIVRKAGISKTTLYSRFASKEALFLAIMEQQIERLSPAQQLISDSGKPNLEQGLKDYANHMLELSLKGDMLGVNRLMYSESHRFPELGKAAAHRASLGIKRISAFIDDCARADGMGCLHPTSVAEVFILTIRGWYIDVILTNRKVTAKQRKAWVDQSVGVLLNARADW